MNQQLWAHLYPSMLPESRERSTKHQSSRNLLNHWAPDAAYQLWLRNQLNSLLITITTVQDCSPIFPQGGQGKRVWLTVRDPSMKAGWQDAPLALRDLAVSNMHLHTGSRRDSPPILDNLPTQTSSTAPTPNLTSSARASWRHHHINLWSHPHRFHTPIPLH